MNVLSLQFSLSNDFLSFEFKLMSKVTNFREDIIRDINPYLQNCERDGDSTIDLEYLQEGGQLYPCALNCEPSGFPFPVLLNGVRLHIGEMLDMG